MPPKPIALYIMVIHLLLYQIFRVHFPWSQGFEITDEIQLDIMVLTELSFSILQIGKWHPMCIVCKLWAWWRHRMETFSALLALCEGNPPVTGGFPSQRPMTRSFDAFFDLNLNKQLSTPSIRRWFEMPSRSLWRHCNEFFHFFIKFLAI